MQDFNFIEISEPAVESEPQTLTIPQDQYLSYFDLTALSPTPQALKKLSKRLVSKYKVLPLALQPKHLVFRLPQRLDNVYHKTYGTPSQVVMYLAVTDPHNEHALRLLHNAIGHELYLIPMLEEAFERFYAEL